MFKRSDKNPIIRPDKNISWRARKTYNPGIIFENDKYHLFFRAVGQAWVSKIGHALSADGENFVCDHGPILEPEKDYEKNGIEDPRIVKIDKKYYLTYIAFDGDTARLCLASSQDMKNWQRHGIVFPDWEAGSAKSFSVSWDSAQIKSSHKNEWVKAGAIFPEKIFGQYWMVFGDRNLWLASSKDMKKWEPIIEPFIEPRKGNYFDCVHVEAGPPPVKTEKGWLVLYHGIDKRRVYRLGYLLLDLNNPQKIIYRNEKPIFEPEKYYEQNGIVDILPGGFSAMETMTQEELDGFIQEAKDNDSLPSVIFCCGAVLEKDILRIYYGGADTVVCAAAADIHAILTSNEKV